MDWFDVAFARFLGYPNPTRKHAEPINCSFDLSSWISGRKDNYPPNWLILQGTPLSFRGMQYDMHTLQYYIILNIYIYIMSDHLQPHCNLQTNTTKTFNMQQMSGQGLCFCNWHIWALWCSMCKKDKQVISQWGLLKTDLAPLGWPSL